jgi:biopolymer transport protein ExbD
MATLAAAPTKGKIRTKRIPLHIDMTPMVDLAFLLLTFFVMTSTLMKSMTLEMNMPDTRSPEPGPPIDHKKVLNLVLGKDNSLSWYMGMPGTTPMNTSFSSVSVRKLLQEKNQQITKLYVLIKPSDQSRYQNTIDVLDELAIAGITRYSLVALTEEDKQIDKR